MIKDKSTLIMSDEINDKVSFYDKNSNIEIQRKIFDQIKFIIDKKNENISCNIKEIKIKKNKIVLKIQSISNIEEKILNEKLKLKEIILNGKKILVNILYLPIENKKIKYLKDVNMYKLSFKY